MSPPSSPALAPRPDCWQVLPVLGLLMAAGLGMRPLHFLFGSPAGVGCLVLGLALEPCGLWWTHRLVTHAEEPDLHRSVRRRSGFPAWRRPPRPWNGCTRLGTGCHEDRTTGSGRVHRLRLG